MAVLGEKLVRLISGADQDCLLVAPYIKRSVMHRLLDVLAPTCPVRVVTRWRLDEIALGVSDLEVWLELVERGHFELWLQPSLHAKYYRADDCVAFGSANLTNLALGWSRNSNLEILHEIGDNYGDRHAFEKALFLNATRVNETLYNEFVTAMEAFPPSSIRPNRTDNPDKSHTLSQWRPRLRFPEDLFKYYAGDKHKDLSTSAKELAAVELTVLNPPPNLSEKQFQRWIAVEILQSAEFQEIERFVSPSRRFGEMKRFLADRGAEEPGRDWQTWMRWIMHFLPQRLLFHTANYSEIVSRPEP